MTERKPTLRKLSNRLTILLITALAGCANAYGQLIVNPNKTAQELAEKISGPGVTISNVTYRGRPAANGFFSGNTNLGLSGGIMLTTGCAVKAIGPNNLTSAECENNAPGDHQLTQMSGGRTFDAATLEFDIIPQSDTLRFRYVFGSEEYPLFVGAFNDIFAFFISGPGITGAKNIALIPGTELPVSINNVNRLDNSAFFINNGDGRNPRGNNTIQYNGFTVVLEAKTAVVPCQTYHLKIVIADSKDEFYDSGVFLEQGSVTSKSSPVKFCSGESAMIGPNPRPGYTYSWSPAIGLSEPDKARTKITLPNTTGSNIIMNYIVKGTGPFCEFYDTVQVTIKPQPSSEFLAEESCAEKTYTLTYTGGAPNPFRDWTFSGNPLLSGSDPQTVKWSTHGEKTISLRVIAEGCTSTVTTKKVFVREPLEVIANNDTIICHGQHVNLLASAVKGFGNYTYYWDHKLGSGQGKIVKPENTTRYIVIAKDRCGNSDSEEVTITVKPKLIVEAMRDTGACRQGVKYTLSAKAGGGNGGNYILSWDQGLGVGNNLIVAPAKTTTYVVKLEDGCSSPAFDTVKIHVDTFPTVDFTLPVSEACMPVAIQFTNNSLYVPGSVFSWEFGDGEKSDERSPLHNYSVSGTYKPYLKIVTPAGCMGFDSSGSITVNPSPVAAFSASTYITTRSKSGITFQNRSKGETIYSWDFGDDKGTSVHKNPVYSYSDTGSFRVLMIVSNAFQCFDSAVQYIQVLEDFSMYIPNAFTPNGDGLNDEFFPHGLSVKTFEMQIYNRWGQQIFAGGINGNEEKNWNGDVLKSGNPAPDGVYMYQIKATDINDVPHYFSGTVSLLR